MTRLKDIISLTNHTLAEESEKWYKSVNENLEAREDMLLKAHKVYMYNTVEDKLDEIGVPKVDHSGKLSLYGRLCRYVDDKEAEYLALEKNIEEGKKFKEFYRITVSENHELINKSRKLIRAWNNEIVKGKTFSEDIYERIKELESYINSCAKSENPICLAEETKVKTKIDGCKECPFVERREQLAKIGLCNSTEAIDFVNRLEYPTNKTEGMSFAEALEAMKKGKLVRRKDWTNDDFAIGIHVPEEGSKFTSPYFYISDTDDYVLPSNPEAEDVMSNDWEVYVGGNDE